MGNINIIPAKNDLVFRSLFGDERNKELLICFLKSIIDLPDDEYDVIEFLDTHLKSDQNTGKEAIVDIRLRTKNG
jgi:predicted transposase/invertase (TIGR01784 family)